jgi:hypothetical protein
MRLTKKQLEEAPLCGNCWNYVPDPDCRIVMRQRGWVHIGNNSVRCSGQADDKIFDDRAGPMPSPGKVAYYRLGESH